MMTVEQRHAHQVMAGKARFKTPAEKADQFRRMAAGLIRKAEQIELEFSATPEAS